MNESLRQLREITEDLPPFPASLETSPGYKQFGAVQGTTSGWDLLSNPDVSVAKVFVSKDSIFPRHAHEQREWLVVYRGSLVVEVSGEEPKRLLAGMSVILEPQTEHMCRSTEDCWLVALTVPHSPDFPQKQ